MIIIYENMSRILRILIYVCIMSQPIDSIALVIKQRSGLLVKYRLDGHTKCPFPKVLLT